MEATLKVIEALTPLVQSLAWPALFTFILFRFAKPIAVFLDNLSEVKLKAIGVEASASREQLRAAALLGAASQKNPGDTGVGLDTTDILNAVSSFTKNPRSPAAPARILWVDDRPSNNFYEREALEQLGMEFGIARSTEEALQKLDASHFDLVISDMGRPPDPRAGYTLLDTLRENKNEIPFVIYAGSREPEHRQESLEHGAIGCTNRAEELFLLVSKGLVVASRNGG